MLLVLPLPFALPLLGLHGDLDLGGDLSTSCFFGGRPRRHGGVENKAFDNGVTRAGISTSGTGEGGFVAGADLGWVDIFCTGDFFPAGDLVLATGGVKIGTGTA